jgi:hypothetical protein
MTREERIQRIGELLAKGISLMMSRHDDEKPSPHAATPPNMGESSEAVTACNQAEKQYTTASIAESTMMSYWRRVGSASPRDLQRGLDLPKTTGFRIMTRLVRSGLVGRSGTTTATRFRLTPWASVGDAAAPNDIEEQPLEFQEEATQ